MHLSTSAIVLASLALCVASASVSPRHPSHASPSHNRRTRRQLSSSPSSFIPSINSTFTSASNSATPTFAASPMSLSLSNGYDGSCYIFSNSSSPSLSQKSNITLALWDGTAWFNASETLNPKQLFNATDLFNATALLPFLRNSTRSIYCDVRRSNSSSASTQIFFEPLQLVLSSRANATGLLANSTAIAPNSTQDSPAFLASSRASTSVKAVSSSSPTSAPVASSTALSLVSSSATHTSKIPSAPSATSASIVSSVQPSPSVSISDKRVFAHHMVGNTYSYTSESWSADVRQAAAAGFDGFVLNIGADPWQPAQVASAYAAAKAVSPSFYLLLSFDVTSLPCSSSASATTLVDLASLYAPHPNQATFEASGRPILSTFSGSTCTFGLSSSDWASKWKVAVLDPVKDASGKAPFFMPTVFVDTSTLSSLDAMDGLVNWNSAWPMTNAEVDFSPDATVLAALSKEQAYTATVSPVFFTHYGKDTWNKNWLYLSDGFLFAKRWELLVESRSKLDFVEALTWNDFGESSYLGPIQGDQPNSEAWVDGMDHQALLEINQFYATAFKTGAYPAITKDEIFLSARRHAAGATAANDKVGRPTGGQNGPADGYLWPKDDFFALVFASQPGVIEMVSGSERHSFTVSAGVNFLQSPLSIGAGMSAQLSRNDEVVASVSPADFTFEGSPASYNFNYHFFGSS